MPPDLPQRLAAILAADIAGYTRLMELDEAGTVAAWRLAREQVIDPTIARHGGRIVKLTGDGFLAEFSTVESAVRAALVMQDELTAAFAAQPADRRVGFRMGVDIGDIWVDNEDVYGTGVNIAARLEGLATPGALCISDAVHAAVKHKIHAHYEDLGLQRVKNVAAPVHAWRASSVPQPRVRRRAADLARPAVAVAALAALAAGGVYSPAIAHLQLARQLLAFTSYRAHSTSLSASSCRFRTKCRISWSRTCASRCPRSRRNRSMYRGRSASRCWFKYASPSPVSAGTSLRLICNARSNARTAMPSQSIAVAYTRGRQIEVSSECTHVKAGSSIEITLSPPPPLNEARTKYTGLGNRWLDRKTANQRTRAGFRCQCRPTPASTLTSATVIAGE